MYRIIQVFCVATSVSTAITGFAGNLAAQTPATTTVPATPAAPRPAKTLDLETVERGQKIFQSNCSFCHGANAKGGESGPDLLRSVLVLDDEGGNKIGVVIHEGRPDKGMPKFPLTNEQIADISAFLHDRIHAAAERGSYQILNIVTGDPKKGEAYFNAAGGCTSCHSVTGDLAHIGSKYDAVTIQQHVVMPRESRRGGRRGAQAAPRPEIKKQQEITAVVTLPSGESFRGRIEQIDDFNIAVVDDNGDYHSFARQGNVPKIEVHDPLQAHTDMLMKYSDADIHNLTAYLVTLK
jgi:cytochrome c oxidase cbb3-type subunit 3